MTHNNDTSFYCAELEFDLVLGRVKNAMGESQRLSPINLKLLSYLIARQDEVISRTELFDAIWPNQIVTDDVLTRAISDVRTQLAKLDSSTRFIETLPKRGYRWVVGVRPFNEFVTASVVGAVKLDQEPDVLSPTSSGTDYHIGSALLCIAAALLLAGMIMWCIGQSMTNQIRVAVLPVSVDRPQLNTIAGIVDDNLARVLRKSPNIQLLSQSAIDSRPSNPFPYFFSEFGARWVIESRISDLDGVARVGLSLVDARTGLELRNASFNVTNSAELSAKLARKLESYLLVDDVDY